MIYRCLPYDYLNLNMCWGYLIYDLLFYYTICFPYVLSVSVLCSREGILIWSLLSTYSLLKDGFIISHGL